MKDEKTRRDNRRNFTLALEEIEALERIASGRGLSASAMVGQLIREEAARNLRKQMSSAQFHNQLTPDDLRIEAEIDSLLKNNP